MKKAVIIPILKQGESPREIKSYRPVFLLSCISKTMEALVAKRLKRWASENNLIPPEQSGFQPGRMTLDVHTNHSRSHGLSLGTETNLHHNS